MSHTFTTENVQPKGGINNGPPIITQPEQNIHMRAADQFYAADTNSEDTHHLLNDEPSNEKNGCLANRRLPLLILLAVSLLVIIGLVIAIVVIQLEKFKITCNTPSCAIQAGIRLKVMNTSAPPCEDFYNYACGNWVRHNTPEPGVGKYSSFYQDTYRLLNRLYLILDEANTTTASPILPWGKAVRFFTACMNMTQRNALGSKPVLEALTSILGGWSMVTRAGLPLNWKLADAISKVHTLSRSPLFHMYVAQDLKNSSENIIIFNEGSSFFSRPMMIDRHRVKYAKAYMKYGTDLLGLIGINGEKLTSRLETMWKIDRELSSFRLSQDSSRNPNITYNKMKLRKFLKTFAQNRLNIGKYLQLQFGRSISPETDVIVTNLQYFKRMARLVDGAKMVDIADYLGYSVLYGTAFALSTQFRDARSTITEVLYGSTVQSPLWMFCTKRTNAVLKYATALQYVNRYLAGGTIVAQAQELANAMKQQLLVALEASPWMDRKTREQAVAKVHRMFFQIAYPKWIHKKEALTNYYLEINPRPDEYYEDNIEILKFERKQDLQRLGVPPRRKEFSEPPLDTNAYYSPGLNKMVLLIGILQRPFFAASDVWASKFGALGAVIGHEMTHGFDNLGKLFDQYGNYRNWWSKTTAERFARKEQCFVKQYSQYEFMGMRNRANTTLGENMADNGGMEIAYNAYINWVRHKGHSQDNGKLPGLSLTRNQLFFVSYAQIYCGHYTRTFGRHAMLLDVHSPFPNRVLGTLSNSKGFADAFSCNTGDKYNPAHKCTLWS